MELEVELKMCCVLESFTYRKPKEMLQIKLTTGYWVIMREHGKKPYFMIYINNEEFFVKKEDNQNIK